MLSSRSEIKSEQSTTHWIGRDTEYLSVFIPNAGKYGSENFKYGRFSCSDTMSYWESILFIIDLFLWEKLGCICDFEKNSAFTTTYAATAVI